jgi:PleD family two-component response regulator
VLNSIGTLKTVAEDAVTIQLGAELFETGRGDQGLQEEMSRARRFERPLTMITVSAKGQRKQQELHQLLVKAQREVIDRYVEGRLYRLLQQKVRDCDIVTRQNGQFLILMPETDRQYAQTILERVQEAAMDEIGLTVHAGIASFPSEERTLVGLLDRASTEMDANLLSSPPRTPK